MIRFLMLVSGLERCRRPPKLPADALAVNVKSTALPSARRSWNTFVADCSGNWLSTGHPQTLGASVPHPSQPWPDKAAVRSYSRPIRSTALGSPSSCRGAPLCLQHLLFRPVPPLISQGCFAIVAGSALAIHHHSCCPTACCKQWTRASPGERAYHRVRTLGRTEKPALPVPATH